MFRSRSWFGSSSLWKPKNPHSLEHLKYLYNVLSKNGTVSESNRGLLVETLRAIAEILIWGDQNDSTVFDFFLEKNMLSFFLRIMKQKCGSYVCVQLLQTLNILFENIRNETSLYYLLSNNHVNSIIVHKFDFSDEEVMAYYISFLKTLSLKLNSHTIHFFYNEHTHDFPLYTEAIKFFNNSESMVRIAVRTLTLNVYRIHDKSMLQFIRDKTAAPYFSNLVWFIGNHVQELDSAIRETGDHEGRIRLGDLVAEHLDHLHYLNDILSLDIESLNQVLTQHLLQRLLIPLYLASLSSEMSVDGPRVSRILALFLLSQVFLIIRHPPLVRLLANLIVNGKENIFRLCPDKDTKKREELDGEVSPSVSEADMEEIVRLASETVDEGSERVILSPLLHSLDPSENDYGALFGLCLLQAMLDNPGVEPLFLRSFFYGIPNGEHDEDFDIHSPPPPSYNTLIVNPLIRIISLSVKYESKIRLVTLELVSTLLVRLVMRGGESCLSDEGLALLEGAREENILLLQNYFKMDEMFLEVFEDEYLDLVEKKRLSMEHLLMDPSLLLPPVGSPLSGVPFDKRLPCGEVERSRRSIRVYFLLRKLSLLLRKEKEKYLPLTNLENCLRVEETLDLSISTSNSDMLSVTVIMGDGARSKRFLVVDLFQLLLVEPSLKQAGWGIVKFVGFLQDIEVLGDKDDSRCLHITIKSSPTNQRTNKGPLFVAKFLFDDHIRSMAAKQRLMKGKQKARQGKLSLIGKLLDLSGTSPEPERRTRRQRRDRPLYTPLGRAVPTHPGSAIPVHPPEGKSLVLRRRLSKEGSPSLHSSVEEEIPLANIRKDLVPQRDRRKSTDEPTALRTLSNNQPEGASTNSSAHFPPASPESETSFTHHQSPSIPSRAALKNGASTETVKKKGTVETV